MGNSAVHLAAARGKARAVLPLPGPAASTTAAVVSGRAQHRGRSRPTSTRATSSCTSPKQVIKSVMSQLEKHGKGIILMHDFQPSHRRGAARTDPPAQGGRLRDRAHGAEGRSYHRAEIRRNARARGQAVVQQYAAGKQRHPHHRRVRASPIPHC